MKALFASLSEDARIWRARKHSDRVNERRQVLALFDAIQVAIAERKQDRASMLLQELHVIVGSALARRHDMPRRINHGNPRTGRTQEPGTQ